MLCLQTLHFHGMVLGISKCASSSGDAFTGDGISGYQEEISLQPGEAVPIGSSIVKQFPFLAGCTALELPSSIADDAEQV